LPVLPLKSTVVFPRIFIPLSVGRKKSLQLLDDLTGAERHIAVATQLDETAEDVDFKDIHHVGTMVRVQHLLKLPDGTVQLAVLGLRRIQLTEADSNEPYLTCAVEMLPEITEEIGRASCRKECRSRWLTGHEKIRYTITDTERR